MEPDGEPELFYSSCKTFIESILSGTVAAPEVLRSLFVIADDSGVCPDLTGLLGGRSGAIEICPSQQLFISSDGTACGIIGNCVLKLPSYNFFVM